MTRTFRALTVLILALLVVPGVKAQVTSSRLVSAAKESQNWLMYSGAYDSRRYSELDQVTPGNVANLELKWVFQAKSFEAFEATPLVVDGVMYTVQAPNDVVALDAATGSVFWIYNYVNSPKSTPCCGSVNRGLAILGDTLYMATIDAHVVAIDAKDGHPLWKKKVAEAAGGYSMTLAPLVVKDKVIVGVSGGELGIRGFIAAYDARSGQEVWKTYTVPGPGEPGHETWPQNDDAWTHGGAPVWLTGSYDPSLNLTYWGVGNPGPDFNAGQRQGDNLYACSVIALNPDTGKITWHFQFTPSDDLDYDSTQIPVLVDAPWNSTGVRKLMYWANRNGFFYVLDRSSGEFLSGKPFAKVTWATGLDRFGRPIRTPRVPGDVLVPGFLGATNWYSPSYSSRTGLFYLSVWDDFVMKQPNAARQEYREGQMFTGSKGGGAGGGEPMIPYQRRTQINTWTEEAGHGALVALDPKTGARKWTYPLHDVATSGVLSTASDLVFHGDRDGFFHAFDARTGAVLWKSSNLGGSIHQGPITFAVNGKQYVATAAGTSLYVFGLR